MPDLPYKTLYFFGEDDVLEQIRTQKVPISSVYPNTFPEQPAEDTVVMASTGAPERWAALGFAMEHRLPFIAVGEKTLTPFTREVFLATGLSPQPLRTVFSKDRLGRLARLSSGFLRRSRSGGDVSPGNLLDVFLLLLHEDTPFLLRVWTDEGEGEIAGREGLVVRAVAPNHRSHEALLWVLTRARGVWVLTRNIRFRATEKGFSLVDALLTYAREMLESESEMLLRFR